MLLLVIYVVGLCTNALQISSKSSITTFCVFHSLTCASQYYGFVLIHLVCSAVSEVSYTCI
jgi:hypothetical protein